MPSRRAILAAAGASAFGTLAGCGGRDASEETATNPTTAANETSTTTAPADHEPFPPDATSFEADLVRGVTVDHPPRFAATLTNEGNKAFTVMCGFAPPFSVTTLDAVDGDASLFCYPVAPEARQHVRAVARFGENATDAPDLPPESRADECWRVTGSYATDDVAYARTLAAGESLRVAYDVYTYGDGPCLPDGDYRATSGASAFPGTSADGPETKWTYGVTFACRDGSVTGVTGSGVREVALTDE
ncbi:hypothetical protein [Halarchaeum nitratireducens]|uniref:Lipoprotein n=1 Tax=Halarchaeum nitratireducens TaxID=489913 RepID=A0A830GCD6_9EURY|nr:hypothetical protein [Halarchaeum nitratireducens]GGN17080.1 hypothetical protein GCM10009021_17240 [Halarchaeum nitratireducens]